MSTKKCRPAYRITTNFSHTATQQNHCASPAQERRTASVSVRGVLMKESFSMKNSMMKRFAASVAVVASLAMVAAGCGNSSTNTNAGPAQTEPKDGYASSYTGKYAMPAKDGVYNNTQDRDNLKDGGTYTYDSTYSPNWNYFNVDGTTSYMSDLWYWYMPTLALQDTKGNLKWNPDFVKSVTMKSANPLVVEMTLADKAKWNDGSDMNWEDVKATWTVMNGKDEAYTPASTDGFKDIKSVERGDSDKQAIITFAKPFFPWQSILTGLYPRMALDPKVFSNGWVDNPHNEWAAGPFVVASHDKDQVVFERNPKWWGKPAKLDKVVVKFMEAQAALNAFQNGETDKTEFTSGPSLKQVKGRKDAQIRYGYSKSTNVFILNGTDKYLKDINVRKAFVQAMDTKTLTKIHYQGTDWVAATPGSELFPVFQEGYEDNRPKDGLYTGADKPKKTMEAAGYKMGKDGYFKDKEGKTVTFSYVYFGSTALANSLARAIQQMGKAAGLKIELDNRDSSKFVDTMNKHEYGVIAMAWSYPSPYSQVNVNQLYGSKSESNYTFVGSKEVDKLADVPGTIPDQLKAVKAANKAEKAALALYGTTTMDVPPAYFAVKKGLANVGPAGFLIVPPENIGWQK